MEHNYNKGKPIGDILLEQKLITPAQLAQALEFQKEKGIHITTAIIKLGFAVPQKMFTTLAQHLGVEYVDLKKTDIDAQAVAKVPAKLALHYRIMPYAFSGDKLAMALVDPLNINKLDDLKILLGVDIMPSLCYEDDIVECIRKYYGVGAEIVEDIMARPDIEGKFSVKASAIEDLEAAVEDASIIKFVNQILTQAVDERATDIHIEPFEHELQIRFRIDGFLYDVPVPESIKLFHQAIISRIKIMANLDIAEHRLPQDGRIKIRIKGEELDLRISILPSYFGESAQLRVLSTKAFLTLEHLGLLEDEREKLDYLITKPYGIIFVTGPTGSGKSTTLYACLSKKNLKESKIITTEDPVEFQIGGVTQIQINPRINLTFAACLRSILRHDPDIIMVGEVRDLETAEITIRSAMTGHLVFSTLHTNDAPSAPLRLMDMKIEPFLVASSLEGIVAQRLVRVICQDCKEQISMDSGLFRKEGIDIKTSTVDVYEGRGCTHCRFTGYRDRTGIFEIILMDSDIREAILKRVSSQEIREKAIKAGMLTLRQSGLRKVLKGVTTYREVMRVT